MHLFLLLGILLAPWLSGPCIDTPQPAAWFTISYAVDTRALPSGLNIAVTTANAVDAQSLSGPRSIVVTASRFEFRNTTSTPLYVLKRRGIEPDGIAASEIPVSVPSYNPRAKLTNTQAFVWNTATQQWEATVAPNAVPGNLALDIEPLLFEPSYTDHNRVSLDRPRNIELPLY